MKIIDLQGVGPAYAQKLSVAGIRTAEALLEKGGSPKARKDIAGKTGISEDLILRWVNHADLCRIKGIGPQYTELLEKAGVDTVVELKKRVAGNLYAKMLQANKEFNIANALPGEKQVAAWIIAAKELPRAVSY